MKRRVKKLKVVREVSLEEKLVRTTLLLVVLVGFGVNVFYFMDTYIERQEAKVEIASLRKQVKFLQARIEKHNYLGNWLLYRELDIDEPEKKGK